MEPSLSMPIGIVRDVVNRTALKRLSSVFYDKKADGTLVTDIDPLLEQIVLEHLLPQLPDDDTIVVAEETSANSMHTIRDLLDVSYFVTLNGVEGTGHFIKHFNGDNQENDLWLMALTVVYKHNRSTALFDPILSFAYQPNTERLFCLADNKPLCVQNPLPFADCYILDIKYVSTDSPHGSVDEFLYKDKCLHSINPAIVRQKIRLASILFLRSQLVFPKSHGTL